MRAAIAALLCVWTLACAPAPPAPAPSPALWRIADADSEIWLFGTVHVLPPELAWESQAVTDAFAAADELVTETDASSTGAVAFPAMVQRYGLADGGPPLSSRMSAEDRARLQRAAREAGLDLAALERMRPWFAALQISYAQATRAGHRSEAGVEVVLAARAQAQGKRLSFFETREAQIRILADLPEDVQLHFLSVTLRQAEGDAHVLAEMDGAWAAGDIVTLGRLLDAQWRQAGPVLHEALILQRNRVWADEIVRRLNGSGRVFVAVGAAHLVGDGNVIALLRARGLEVEGP
ncbi:MAG: TraB/GumN family protein [Hyphomonadaceae bacterium]